MDRATLIRKLRYQASRRASLELEMMLDRLVSQSVLETFTDDELIDLDELLKIDEIALENVLLHKGPRPEGIPLKLWEKILELLIHPKS
ncbi:MAG: succinate dehydrogenase assembly factor 2 [Deltaproteobacteria bacterium]|nr:succinate dehydrogenase assembly factor 2 [Deltaproteobacteria bacterium]